MTVEFSGTLTATPGTEHILAAPSTDKARVLCVDVSALSGAETVQLRIKEPVLQSGTERLVRLATFATGEPEPHTKSPSFKMAFGGTFTLTQISGTGRSFPWRIDTLD